MCFISRPLSQQLACKSLKETDLMLQQAQGTYFLAGITTRTVEFPTSFFCEIVKGQVNTNDKCNSLTTL